MDPYQPVDHDAAPAPMSPPGMTPPIEHGDGGFGYDEEPSKWPRVIGIIGIVLASLGLACGCIGFFGEQMQQWGMNQMAQQPGGIPPHMQAQIDASQKFKIYSMILLVISLLVSVIHMAGSISLIQRKPVARIMLLLYAAASILITFANVAMYFAIAAETERLLQAQGESMPAGAATMGLVFLGIGIIIGLAWPIFLLIWFLRGKIVSEVESWRTRLDVI